jgi:hypothetical protein
LAASTLKIKKNVEDQSVLVCDIILTTGRHAACLLKLMFVFEYLLLLLPFFQLFYLLYPLQLSHPLSIFQLKRY